MIAKDVLSPAEVVAASLCWLASMRPGGTLGQAAGDQVNGYWHRGSCRYCRTERAELMRQIVSSQADERFKTALEAFEKLPRAARAARVREAMEQAWYDEVTR